MSNTATQTAAIAPPDFNFESPTVEEIRKHQTRFFVQTGWEELHVGSNAVHGKKFLRCVITPVTSYQRRDRWECIREEMRIKGSEHYDPTDRTKYGRYWIFAKDEAERLINIESNAANSGRPNGLREIECLRGKEEQFTRLKLNILYSSYPDPLPETNAGLIAFYEKRLAEINELAPESAARDDLELIRKVGEELIAAAKNNAMEQLQRIEYSHSCLKLRPNEPAYKKTYDGPDEELLRRTGHKRISAADQATASALELLAGNKAADASKDDLRELLSFMQRQQEQQADMIKSLFEQLLERGNTEPKTARPKKEGDK